MCHFLGTLVGIACSLICSLHPFFFFFLFFSLGVFGLFGYSFSYFPCAHVFFFFGLEGHLMSEPFLFYFPLFIKEIPIPCKILYKYNNIILVILE